MKALVDPDHGEQRDPSRVELVTGLLYALPSATATDHCTATCTLALGQSALEIRSPHVHRTHAV